MIGVLPITCRSITAGMLSGPRCLGGCAQRLVDFYPFQLLAGMGSVWIQILGILWIQCGVMSVFASLTN